MDGIITGVDARLVLDSRGFPTIETDCYVDGILAGRDGSSGASTGAHEAIELRDGDETDGLERVGKAVNNG